jgi:hypothetical protein
MASFTRQTERNWAGLIVPAVLLLALLADGLSRFLPLDHFSIRAWEAMTRNGSMEAGIPFEPLKRYESNRAFGDQASRSNHRQFRDYHHEVFTSDQFGFRNPQAFSPANPPDALLVGSSFSVGCGVSDNETLAVRLGEKTGQKVYNAAGMLTSPEEIATIVRRFGMQRGTVFFELLAGLGFPTPPVPISPQKRMCIDRLGLTCLRIKGWALISPLGIISQRAYRWFEDDAWLPNVLGGSSVPTLVDGIPILMSHEDFTCPGVSAESAREYFRSFREGLGDLDLFVVLTPSKSMVYGPLSDGGPWGLEGAASENCFAVMTRALNDAGVPYIDLTDPMRLAAKDALSRNELLYFAGDTHWNAAGIDVAAKLVGQTWSARLTGQRKR